MNGNDPDLEAHTCRECGRDFCTHPRYPHKGTDYCPECLHDVWLAAQEEKFQARRDGE